MSVEEARPPPSPRFIVGDCIDFNTYRNICVVDIKENSFGKYYVFDNGWRQWVKFIDGGILDMNAQPAEYHTPVADTAAGAPAAGGRRRKKRKGSKSKKTKKTKKSRKSRKSRKSKK